MKNANNWLKLALYIPLARIVLGRIWLSWLYKTPMTLYVIAKNIKLLGKYITFYVVQKNSKNVISMLKVTYLPNAMHYFAVQCLSVMVGNIF